MAGVLASFVLKQSYPLSLPHPVPLASTNAKAGAVNYENLGVYNLVVGPVTDGKLQEFAGLPTPRFTHFFNTAITRESPTSTGTYSEGDVTRVFWRLSIPVEEATQSHFTSRGQVGPLEPTQTFTGTVDVRYTATVNNIKRTTLIGELKTPGVIRRNQWENPNNAAALKSALGQEMRWYDPLLPNLRYALMTEGMQRNISHP